MAEIDREKVIKGLHCCSHTDGANCIYCPYDIRDTDCTALMSMDVLELLKEQEEQIKNRDESLEKAREEIKWLRGMLKEQEAKTGKWERQYSRPGVYANLLWWCSVCGEPTRYNDAGIFYKYCPRCGAKLEPCIET